MKKIAHIALTLILSVLMLFSLACNMEEYNYLHDNLDKSKATPKEFTEWMYKRTKTSIKLSRPNSEIKYNVELLMEYYDYLDEYLDREVEKVLDRKDKEEHLEYYDMLSPILEKYAKIVDENKIWVGKTWRDVGRALNMTTNSAYMCYIANQIMAKNIPVGEYEMYKEILREAVVEGEEIVEVIKQSYSYAEKLRGQVVEGEVIVSVVNDNDGDPQTTSEYDIVKVKYNVSAKDTVRVKFKDEVQAQKIAQDFIQNAIEARPSNRIGELYVISCMYRFAEFIGYEDAVVYEEEYNPGDGDSGENEDGSEIIRTPVDLYEYFQRIYLSYVGL
jgi:hypothetical protein